MVGWCDAVTLCVCTGEEQLGGAVLKVVLSSE